MIKFTLICRNDHEFEAWFGSSAEYDRQNAAGLVNCVICDDGNISKALMAPNLRAKGNKTPTPPVIQQTPVAQNIQPTAQAGYAAAQPNQQNLAEKAAALITQMRAMRKQVEDNFDNVGDDFAETARRIHYGEEDTRGIYGNASNEDVEELIDEGIDIFALPDLPKDN